jgi:hemerythrin-like domain-containing protein
MALHTIGEAHVPDFNDPLGLMSHCHRKMEGFLAGLAASGELLLGGRRVELAGAFQVVDAAREHFAVRGRKHTEDEEVSLFPRMREYGGHAAGEALAALAALEIEHRVAEGAHAEFDELVERLPRDGSAGVKEIYLFNELVAELADLYRPHIFPDQSTDRGARRFRPRSGLACARATSAGQADRSRWPTADHS